MLEISITQAQKQFSTFLNTPTTIVDKKKSIKKAVILPYEIYSDLINNKINKKSLSKGGFAEFTGVLDNDFKTNDTRYNKIIK